MISTLVRPAFLVLALFLVPACSEGRRVSPTLFSESFDSGFPTSNWTTPVATGLATAATDFSSGLPAPSLKLSSSTATASLKTDTVSSFNNPSVTISVAIADLSGGTAEPGSGSVSILDGASAVVASAIWNNTTGQITFHINGGAPDGTVSPASDGNFHQIVFNVTGSGLATWTFDGGSALVTQGSFPGGLLKIELGATFGATTPLPSFFFDNITVTSP